MEKSTWEESLNESRCAQSKQSFKRTLSQSCRTAAYVLLAFNLLILRRHTNLRWPAWQGCMSHMPEAGPSDVLEVFEVYKPLKIDDTKCQSPLMEHTFGWSYGKPFVGTYTPPDCSWTHVTFNLSFVSRGVQFDRLALLFIDDVEIWRTSTAEPTRNGIHWEYHKDMTAYRSLLLKPGKVIMELGNLLDNKYTGAFNGTLTATYFVRVLEKDVADTILPLSRRKSHVDKPSAFSLPRDNASVAIALPKRTQYSKAIVSLTASGNADEEFWYMNVPSSLANTFDSPLPPYSAFREVQLLLDGTLVGVAWPFPVIFTGGVSPGLWRPIVGIATFDLIEDEIDVTPWSDIFADGHEHIWEIRVVGISEDETGKHFVGGHVGNDWIVSGRLLLWEDQSPRSALASKPRLVHEIVPSVHIGYEITQDADETKNTSLIVALSVQRTIITSLLTIPPLKTSHTLSFSSISATTANGLNQTIDQFTQSSRKLSDGSLHHAKYPFNVTNNIVLRAEDGGFSIIAAVDRTLHIHEAADGKGMRLETRQNGTSVYVSPKPGVGGGSSVGHTEQVFEYASQSEELGDEVYARHVEAKDSVIVMDDEFVGMQRVNRGRETNWYVGRLEMKKLRMANVEDVLYL